MKWIAMAALALVFAVARPAAAQTYNINLAKGYMQSAEDQFKAGDLRGARFKLNMVWDELKRANSDMKADPLYPKIEARAKALEAKLAPMEESAASAQAAKEKAEETRSWHMTAEENKDGDPDKAVADANKCVEIMEEAFKIDAGVKKVEISMNDGKVLTGAQIHKSCSELAVYAKKVAAGEAGPSARDTEEGKQAVIAFNAAYKAMKDKNIDAEGLMAGQKGAEDCRTLVNGLHSLTSTRSRQSVYRGKGALLETDAGELSLTAMDEQCSKFQGELFNRKATGCGKRAVNVQQTLVSLRKWGPVEAYAQTHYEVISCESMPKGNKFPGEASKHDSRFKKLCGRKAIYVIDDSSWQGDSTRRIGGYCYDKGKLFFRAGSPMVKGG